MLTKLKRFFTGKPENSEAIALEIKIKGDVFLQEENYEAAVEQYRRVISRLPENLDALVNLGFALCEIGDFDEAMQHLEAALSITPDSSDAHYIKGNIHKQKGDFRNAITHYLSCIDSDPRNHYAYRDLVFTLQACGNIDQAKNTLKKAIYIFPELIDFHFSLAEMYFNEKAYEQVIDHLQKALKIKPGHPECNLNLAKALAKTGRNEEAIACYQKVLSNDAENFEANAGIGTIFVAVKKSQHAIRYLELASLMKPDDISVRQNLGNAYHDLGTVDKALAQFKEVVRIDPNSPLKHLIASFSGITTDSAPKEYIENLFDEYASSFDSHLAETLEYNVPQSILSLVQSYRNLDDGKLDILDLGCGTGLFGRVISPFARQITGVDLSAKMLEKAQQSGIYDRLVHKELIEMMQDEPSYSYDLIAATDVLVYMGSLDQLVAHAKRILRRNGTFVFSVELFEELQHPGKTVKSSKFYLNQTGRYSHSVQYLNQLAKNNQFDILGTKQQQIRLDKGNPIIGLLNVWQCF